MFALAVVPAGHRGPPQFVDYKHSAAFAVLGALALVSWPRDAARSVLGLLCFGAAIEIVQLVPVLNRGASLGDLASDFAGIVLGMVATSWAATAAKGLRPQPSSR